MSTGERRSPRGTGSGAARPGSGRRPAGGGAASRKPGGPTGRASVKSGGAGSGRSAGPGRGASGQAPGRGRGSGQPDPGGPLGRVGLEVLQEAVADALRVDRPADLALREFFRQHAFLGRRDRGVVAETVFDVLRHRRLYEALSQGIRGPMSRTFACLSVLRRFGTPALPGLQLNPPETEAFKQAVAIDPAGLPQAVRLSLPDWLHAELLAQARKRLGDEASQEQIDTEVEAVGRALLQPAPLDLRVNLLKSDRPAVLAALSAAGIAAEALADVSTAIRVRGKPAIDKLAAFEAGDFEVQDAGSQRLAEFTQARRGQMVVDFCAGAGGKTLAMAAAMRNTGQIYACDTSPVRLQRLRPRLMRSGATNVQPFGLDSENDRKLRRLAGRADLVLVDAPCSGTGTLRRNPELKWRMDSASVDTLHALQCSILSAAARLVKPGGALVYATCSLVRRENEAVVAAFRASHPQFGEPELLRVRPEESDSDGFFAARWVLPR